MRCLLIAALLRDKARREGKTSEECKGTDMEEDEGHEKDEGNKGSVKMVNNASLSQKEAMLFGGLVAYM